MVVVLLIAFVVLTLALDLALRTALQRARDKKRRRECEEALAVSLKLDFSREAKTLVRAEVKEPTARILCVDDEEVILDSFRKILVPAGFSVDTVQTGQEALGLIQTHHYDFVFTDLRMPAMDGVDVVKSVKHMRPDIDVVVITGFATVETAVECMKFGATDYVQKPFAENELLDFLKKSVIRRNDRIQKQLQPGVQIVTLPDADRVGSRDFSIPGGVLISRGHAWASLSPEGAVKVGIDDFARKLIGRIDAVELPNVGMAVKAGQPLFTLRQGARLARFHAPVSGRIVKVNPELNETCEGLEITPYGKNWMCVIDGDSLDKEIPALRIGKAAVALFQEDIERFRTFMQGITRKDGTDDKPDGSLHVGELEHLTDAQWDVAVREFFG